MSSKYIVLIYLLLQIAYGINFPLKCEDLSTNDTYTSSFNGSHHYIGHVDQNEITLFGLPSLYFRQFSDWNYGSKANGFEPLFPKILNFDTEDWNMINSILKWRPDFVDSSALFSCILFYYLLFYIFICFIYLFYFMLFHFPSNKNSKFHTLKSNFFSTKSWLYFSG
jgi:hypothetical protein